ncbi:MAG TPA: hypothetical protein VGQ83_18175 [Polyangia bacterium]
MRVLFAAVLAVTLGSAGAAGAQPVYDDSDESDPAYAYGAEAAPEAQEAAPEAQEAAPQAEQEWRYNGPHAINADYGSGWCNIQEPHSHPYPPFDDQLFQEDNGGYDFVGDPVDFGYVGAVFWFVDAHPVASGWGHGWCYRTGPHRHLYRPWGTSFRLGGRGYAYTGPYDAAYWRHRSFFVDFWNRTYPAHYHGGRYLSTRVPASPGRWAAYRPGGRYYRAPVARPGGYARPAARPPLARPATLQGRIGYGPGHAVPRLAPAPARRIMPAPRVAPGPRMTSAPRAPGFAPRAPTPRMGRAAAPVHRPTHVSAPRSSTRSTASSSRHR